MFNRNIGIVLLVALAAGLGLLLAQKFFSTTAPSAWPPTRAVQFYPQPRMLPEFSLRQSDGTQLAQGELKGHWTLVFLGFTFCPDVCPTTLTDLSIAQQQWQSLPDSTRPRLLLVSVDPDRDPPARLGEYAHAFHKDTLAATADSAALEHFANALGLVFRKVTGKTYAENPNDYSMDHSAGFAVLDPQARLVGVIRPPLDAKVIASDMTLLTQASAP
jgi:protein SCO1/2